MQALPPRPVLNRAHPLARGLVGAWPQLGASREQSLTGKNDMTPNCTAARTVGFFGRGRTLTPIGADLSGVSALKTTTVGGVLPAFPMTAWLVARATSVTNAYLFGRWGGSWDWLIASIGGLLYIYQGNAGTAQYRYWVFGTVAMTTWRALSVSFESVTASPVVRSSAATGIDLPLVVGAPAASAGLPAFTQGTAEIGINSAYETILGADVADARVWDYAMTSEQQSKLHKDPWAMYRPRRVSFLRGVVAAATFPWLSTVLSRANRSAR